MRKIYQHLKVEQQNLTAKGVPEILLPEENRLLLNILEMLGGVPDRGKMQFWRTVTKIYNDRSRKVETA